MNKLNKETEWIQTTLTDNYECDDGDIKKEKKAVLIQLNPRPLLTQGRIK